MTPSSPAPNNLRTVLILAAIGITYYFVHHTGFLFLDPEQRIATIWPASGLALGIVLLQPRRLWVHTFVVIAIANATSNLLNGNTVSEAVGFLTASMLELAIGILIMAWFAKDSVTFSRVAHVLGLITAATVGNGLVAFIASLNIKFHFDAPFWASYRTWWVSDGLGILLVTPSILVWRGRDPFGWQWSKVIETAAFVIIWIIAVWAIFPGPHLAPHALLQPYMLSTLLAWPALRLGPKAVTVGLLILTGVSLLHTIGNPGIVPLGGDTPTERLLLVQLYLGATAIAGLLLATSLSQTQEAEKSAVESAKRIVRANRALRTLSNCNQAVVRASTEAELLNGICRVIVEDGGYRLAWVGFVEHDNDKKISVAAQAGYEDGYLDSAKFTWADDESGSSPVGTAVKTRRPVVCHDFLKDPLVKPWREDAIQCGYNASLVVPLEQRNQVFGTLSVYAKDADSFDSAEIALLSELAEDLAYGLQALRIEAEHRSVREALAASEEQFRQSQKMEAIGQLAGGIAHDFNNLLTAILGYSSMAEHILEEKHRVRGYITEITKAAERAASLTRQLLAFSRRQIMQPKHVDLNDVVTNLVKMLERLVGEHISMQLRLHPEKLITHADAGMIDQVLLNLSVNARDSMPGGGQLLISTSAKKIDNHSGLDLAPGDYVSLTVSDRGCGIPEHNLPKIFDPFFTTKETGKGTGLGLATVFGIVKQHQGAITVTSEVGKGTTFEVLIPVGRPESGQLRPEVVNQFPKGGTETILVVEDEPAVRGLTKSVLEEHGYEVLDAGDGVEAVELWSKHQSRVHLLLTDIVMPAGISGLELAAKLQVSKPDLRVIFTSGYSADLAGKDLDLQEGQNFLEKPSRPDQLLATVRRCLDR